MGVSEGRLTAIDGIYIPVKNKERSMKWFIEHFGLQFDEENRLKLGALEVFFLETLDAATTNFSTKDWVRGQDHYEMPAFCFRASDILSLYSELKESNVRVEPLLDQRWFYEFDFYDLDNNKFKVWQSKKDSM